MQIMTFLIFSFSSLVLLNPSYALMYRSASALRHRSICILPLMCKTKFHTHTKTGKIIVLCFDLLILITDRKTQGSEVHGSKHS
jgi:hypothetical protein